MPSVPQKMIGSLHQVCDMPMCMNTSLSSSQLKLVVKGRVHRSEISDCFTSLCVSWTTNVYITCLFWLNFTTLLGNLSQLEAQGKYRAKQHVKNEKRFTFKENDLN